VIGKASFSAGDLADNYLAVLDEVLRAKPAAAKGKYVKSITLAPSMGPGVRVDVTRLKETARDSAASAVAGVTA
jgi:large subunit ribosomal protein L1